MPADEQLARLPPLPSPNHYGLHNQFLTGCFTVGGIIFVCVAATITAACLGLRDEPALMWASIIAVCIEAIVAVGCFVAIHYVDPGVIHRGPHTCLPLPAVVKDALDAGTIGSFGHTNLVQDGRTFCVRCFVWRPATPAFGATHGHGGIGGGGCRCGIGVGVAQHVHHCSDCQRCVVDFDHHCGVLGRCIAGKGLRGNLIYFRLLIIVGQIGVLTASAAVIGAVSKTGEWWALGVGAGVIYVCGGGLMLIRWLRCLCRGGTAARCRTCRRRRAPSGQHMLPTTAAGGAGAEAEPFKPPQPAAVAVPAAPAVAVDIGEDRAEGRG